MRDEASRCWTVVAYQLFICDFSRYGCTASAWQDIQQPYACRRYSCDAIAGALGRKLHRGMAPCRFCICPRKNDVQEISQ